MPVDSHEFVLAPAPVKHLKESLSKLENGDTPTACLLFNLLLHADLPDGAQNKLLTLLLDKPPERSWFRGHELYCKKGPLHD